LNVGLKLIIFIPLVAAASLYSREQANTMEEKEDILVILFKSPPTNNVLSRLINHLTTSFVLQYTSVPRVIK
jgi:hypothetical protein